MVAEDTGYRHENDEFAFRMNKEQDYHALEKLKFPISIVHRSKKREWDFKEDWIERCERERG